MEKNIQDKEAYSNSNIIVLKQSNQRMIDKLSSIPFDLQEPIHVGIDLA